MQNLSSLQSSFNVASPPPLHRSCYSTSTTTSLHCCPPLLHHRTYNDSKNYPINRSGMPLASTFDLWNKMCTSLAIFRDQLRVDRSFFERERRKEQAGGRREEEEEERASGELPGQFRPLVRRKEPFGRPRAERMGPALRAAQDTCTPAWGVPTAMFRPIACRKVRFGPRRADGTILVKFNHSA